MFDSKRTDVINLIFNVPKFEQAMTKMCFGAPARHRFPKNLVNQRWWSCPCGTMWAIRCTGRSTTNNIHRERAKSSLCALPVVYCFVSENEGNHNNITTRFIAPNGLANKSRQRCENKIYTKWVRAKKATLKCCINIYCEGILTFDAFCVYLYVVLVLVYRVLPISLLVKYFPA